MDTWAELKRRKIVQWTIAYLAGAWLMLDVTSLVGGHLGWPEWIHRALIVLAGVGLPIALVVAWYHGEKGRQKVSGPEAVMVAALLVVAAVAVHLVRPDRQPAGPEAGTAPVAAERSIAVLPLDDLSPGEGQAYLAGAITEEITSALTEVPDLTVKSRTSASKYAQSDMTLSEFAREIGVRHVLEGSVQRAGDQVRVTVQLIEASNDEHVWSETYDRTIGDLLSVQVEIAREVADRLAATFTERERERILAGATDDPVAYDLYLRATSPTEAAADRLDLLREAVERDPGFWPGWERLAFYYEALDRRQGGGWGDSSRVAIRRAIRAAEHPAARLRLEAYRSLMFGGEEEERTNVARLRAAAEERPSDLLLVDALADFHRIRGRFPEAARWRWRAARLDPLNPERWQNLYSLYLWTGMYDVGERLLDRAMELDPGSAGLYLSRMYLWSMQGRVDRALAAVDSVEAVLGADMPLVRGWVHWWAGEIGAADASYAAFDLDERVESSPEWHLIPMARVEQVTGDSARARRILDHVRAIIEARTMDDYEPEWRVFPRLQLAAVDGDHEAAVRLFRRYVERGGRDPNWFEQSPLFQELRADPAFREELTSLHQVVGRMRRELEQDLPSSF